MTKTVLIVEDYEDARVMMKVLVELCGYKAVEAQDGFEAIEKANIDTVVSGDVSCLMQIGGRLSRLGSKTKTMHLAEVLALQE